MKKYLWSFITVSFAGLIVTIISTDSAWIRNGMDILDMQIFHFSAETNIGIILLTYLFILALLLIVTFFDHCRYLEI